jgi:hypothetical protein
MYYEHIFSYIYKMNQLTKNKNIRYFRLLLKVLSFFILLSLTGHFLKDYRPVKLVVYSSLILMLSYTIYQYFSFIKSSAKDYLVVFFTVFLSFECMKFIKFLSGSLPRYTDAPLFISAVSVYLLIIVSATNVMKR